MNRKLLIIIMAVVVAAGIFLYIKFVENNNQKPGMVALMDKNNDNVLSRDEFPMDIKKEFDTLDLSVNRDNCKKGST